MADAVSNHGFQFDGAGGLFALGTQAPDGKDINAAFDPSRAVEAQKATALEYDFRVVGEAAVQKALASVERKFAGLAKPGALKPRDVVKLARARVKEIKRTLRNMKRLQKEQVELERLIAAADGKTLAPVRAIDTARRSAG